MSNPNEDEIQLGTDMGSIPRQEQSEVVPASSWLVEIVGCSKLEADPKKDKGAQLFIRFKVEECSNPDYSKYKGAVFVDTLSLKETALWKVVLLSDAIEGKKTEGTSLKYKSFIGKKIVVRTSLENYQGGQSTRVQAFMHTSKWRGVMPASESSAAPASKPTPAGEVEI